MAGGFHADSVHAGIGAAIAGHILKGVDDAFDAFSIDRLRTGGFRHLQAFGNFVDGDYAACTEHESAADCELPHGPAAPDRDGVARFYVAVDCGHITGGKDVRKKDGLFIGEMGWNFQWPHIGGGDTSELIRAACLTAHHVRVAEGARPRIAHHLVGDPGIGSCVVAAGPQLVLAEKTLATSDSKGNDDAITNFECVRLNGGANFNDLTHKFMPENVALLERGNVAVIQMKIGTADAGAGDAYDCVARIQDFRIGDIFDTEFFFAHPADSLHDVLNSAVCRPPLAG